jgi:hypothetical protein
MSWMPCASCTARASPAASCFARAPLRRHACKRAFPNSLKNQEHPLHCVHSIPYTPAIRRSATAGASAVKCRCIKRVGKQQQGMTAPFLLFLTLWPPAALCFGLPLNRVALLHNPGRCSCHPQRCCRCPPVLIPWRRVQSHTRLLNFTHAHSRPGCLWRRIECSALPQDRLSIPASPALLHPRARRSCRVTCAPPPPVAAAP